MIITNSRYALVGYFITSYPTRAHGIIVKYCSLFCGIVLIQLHETSLCSFLSRLFFCDFQPQFITLAHLWTGFQDEMVLLSVLSNILASLEPFTKVFVLLQLPIPSLNFKF